MSTLLKASSMKKTPLQCRHCTNLIKRRLKGKIINQPQNCEIVSGYKSAIDLISKGVTSYEKIDLSSLNTPQARAIAFLSVDFVNGITAEKILLKIPLRKL